MEQNLKKFAKGEVIFKEGAMEYFMYDLIEGKVGIYANYGTPGEKLLTELKKEDTSVTFGEMGLIDVMPRSATAVALEDVAACLVDGNDFGDYFEEDPEAVLAIMRSMSKRIRSLSQDYLEACHAIAEVAEAEKSGRQRGSWFKRAVKKFMDDYQEAMQYADQDCSYYAASIFDRDLMWRGRW